MEINATQLKAKGWSDYEIHQAEEYLKKADDKHPGFLIVDRNLYWLLLFVAVVGNIALSISLLPIIVGVRGIIVYIITGLIGLMFGFLCTALLRGVHHIKLKHHLTYTIIVPLAGISNFIIMVNQANIASKTLEIPLLHNPYLLGSIYLFFFFVPYVILTQGDRLG
ncbi:hypothetical protein ACFL1B_01310 [Nanoarchaeota archaeon]